MSYITQIARICLDWLYPRLCVHCHVALLREEEVLCSHCATRLSLRSPLLDRAEERLWASPIFHKLHSLYIYDKGNVCQSLIYSYKYRGNWAIAKMIAQRAVLIKDFAPNNYDLILAIPLSPNHWHARGYNQALLLAQALASMGQGLRYSDTYILRKHQTKSQKALNRVERRLMMQNIFYINPHKQLDWSNLRILVVDDVLTTGATLLAYLSVLEDAGAKQVDVFTIATTALHLL